MNLSVEAFVRGLPATKAARLLARTMDRDRNGLLSDAEVADTLEALHTDRTEAPVLRRRFEQVFGLGSALLRWTPEDLSYRMATERSAAAITVKEIENDLRTLCKTREYSVRDATDPAGYRPAAEWWAQALVEAGGAQPLGDVVDGERSFLQGFRWQTRFGDQRPAHSWNVIGEIPGLPRPDGKPNVKVVFSGHLDNLSHDEKQHYLAQDGRNLLESYEGANDNTCAPVAQLAIARAVKRAGPVEGVDFVFYAPSAEEEGLKGTEAFFMDPTFDLGQMMAFLNLEMIGDNVLGRILIYGGDTAGEAARNELYQRVLKTAAQAGIQVLPGHENDDGEKWNARTDSKVAQAAGYNAIAVHGGTTADRYHHASDDLEHVNLPKVRTVAELMFRVARDLAKDPIQPGPRHAPAPRLNVFPGWVKPGLETP